MSGSLQKIPTFFWMRHCATMAPALPSVTRTWQMVGLGHNPWWLSYHVWLGDFSRQSRGCCDTVYLFFLLNNKVISQERSTKKYPGRFSPPLRPPDFMDEVLCPENVPFQTGSAPCSNDVATVDLPICSCGRLDLRKKKTGCVAHCLFWASGVPRGNFQKANP